MSNDKRPPAPVFLGGTAGREDPNLARHRAAIEARAAERRANQEPGPDLASALAYDPKRDGHLTMEQIGERQRALAAPPQAPTTSPAGSAPRRASDETIAGLTALREQVQMKQNQEEASSAAAAPEKAQAPQKDERSRAIEEVDDLQLDRLLSLAQPDSEDFINNKRERDAVEKRVRPINVMDGVLSGEFTQWVPIVPERDGIEGLKVLYRTVTPQEDQKIRLYIFKITSADGRYEAVATELYRLLTLTCGVVQINGSRLPDHYKRDGFVVDVNEEVLGAKLNHLLSFPMPLIHALSTHQFWFDQRVRKAFSTVDLGNG